MPNYTYQCHQCKHEIVILLETDERDTCNNMPCLKCSGGIERMLEGTNKHLDNTRKGHFNSNENGWR